MISRKDFLRMGALGVAGMALPKGLYSQDVAPIVGHGKFRYRVHRYWGELDRDRHPVKDGHEMVVDRKGLIYLLTNETRNNIIIYDFRGRLVDTWGHEYPGGHGLSIKDEGGEEFLYICDYERHEVIKTTLKGRVVMTISAPLGSDHYTSADQFKPTETAIAESGDIYVADGYGQQWISVFDQQGHLKKVFGGPEHFSNAHGICIDDRKANSPTLLITAREQNMLKRFSLDGEWLSDIHLPGAFINRPVIAGKNVYLSVLKAASYPDAGSGFVVILDKKDQVVSCPGGSHPDSLETVGLHQTLRLFNHPHDVAVDRHQNLYIPQWNSNGLYPIMLERL